MGAMPRPAARVCIIGTLRVERGDVVVESVQLGSRKARLVLALLAADPSRIRPAGELAEALWPDGAPDSAAATIASLVSRLRRTHGGDLIAGGRSGFRLDPSVTVDLDEAAGLVEQAERRLTAGQPALAVPATSAALALLTGTALADLGDADWVHAVRTRQAALHRRARSVAGRARLAVGDHAGAAEVARAALADDPLDEDAARVLMTALSAAGEPNAALPVFDELRHRLREELGTDPAPATAALHTEILRGTVPSLEPAAAARDDRGELVGREREFTELSTAWSAAANGAGALVLITGDPGAGKTRLADELSRLVRETGGMVLSARCYEAERALFLQPVVEAITDAVSRRPPAEVLAAAAGHLDSLGRLVPAIGALVEQQQVHFAAAEVERRRAVQAVSVFLCELARVRPVLLQLDDLHNAGESSIELLHFLRTVLPSAAVLVVATVRTDEGAELLATLAPVATRLEVGPLAPSAVRALAVAAGRGHRADEIVQRTGGHALFVAEILRGADDDDAIPATLQVAVLTRTARLGRSATALLRAGAVLGASFDPQHAATLAGLALPVALADCERALQVGLLRTAGRSYEFANDLVREVLYATTPLPTRLAHHAHAVDLLTGAPEQVAAHATAIDDWPRAARAWLVAADDALRSFAAADGAALAGRALSAAERADDLELTGRALVLRGRARDILAAFAEAWNDFTAAVDAARQAGDRRLEMIALREIAGNVPVALGNPPAMAEEPLRRCLYLAEQLGARTTEADVLGRLAILSITSLDFVSALAFSEQALRTARVAADDRALEFALDARKSCWAYLGEIDRLDAGAARARTAQSSARQSRTAAVDAVRVVPRPTRTR